MGDHDKGGAQAAGRPSEEAVEDSIAAASLEEKPHCERGLPSRWDSTSQPQRPEDKAEPKAKKMPIQKKPAKNSQKQDAEDGAATPEIEAFEPLGEAEAAQCPAPGETINVQILSSSGADKGHAKFMIDGPAIQDAGGMAFPATLLEAQDRMVESWGIARLNSAAHGTKALLHLCEGPAIKCQTPGMALHVDNWWPAEDKAEEFTPLGATNSQCPAIFPQNATALSRAIGQVEEDLMKNQTKGTTLNTQPTAPCQGIAPPLPPWKKPRTARGYSRQPTGVGSTQEGSSQEAFARDTNVVLENVEKR